MKQKNVKQRYGQIDILTQERMFDILKSEQMFTCKGGLSTWITKRKLLK